MNTINVENNNENNNRNKNRNKNNSKNNNGNKNNNEKIKVNISPNLDSRALDDEILLNIQTSGSIANSEIVKAIQEAKKEAEK